MCRRSLQVHAVPSALLKNSRVRPPETKSSLSHGSCTSVGSPLAPSPASLQQPSSTITPAGTKGRRVLNPIKGRHRQLRDAGAACGRNRVLAGLQNPKQQHLHTQLPKALSRLQCSSGVWRGRGCSQNPPGEEGSDPPFGWYMRNSPGNAPAAAAIQPHFHSKLHSHWKSSSTSQRPDITFNSLFKSNISLNKA